MILSLIHGNVEYSWLTPETLIPVTLVPGIEDNKILLNEFPNVTQYPLGRGPTVKDETLSDPSFWVIFGTQIVLWIMCMRNILWK